MGTTAEDAGPRPRRYRGFTAEERRAERRRKLLAAGLEQFATAGYVNTSVERICSAAGVTGRHFYEEFASREQLLVAVHDEVVGRAFARVVEQVRQADDTLAARLEAGVAAYMHELLDDPRQARLLIIESVGISAELDRHRRELGAQFAAFITAQAEALVADGVQVHGSPFTAVALVAAINELTVAWLLDPGEFDVDDLVAEGVRIIRAVALG